jgi:hypothetical protein
MLGQIVINYSNTLNLTIKSNIKRMYKDEGR